MGSVKSRLAAGIGAEAACAAYRTMIDHLMPAVRESGLPVALCHTPDEAGADLSPWLEPGWELTPQGDGDLGVRLDRAFAASVAAGFERTLIIGTDCPYLTAQDLWDAESALRQHQVVVGPAADGGYWLIGMRGLHPDLFRAIPWSSPDVLRVTLQRAAAAGLAVHRLRELEDIDTLPAWQTFQRHLKACETAGWDASGPAAVQG